VTLYNTCNVPEDLKPTTPLEDGQFSQDGGCLPFRTWSKFSLQPNSLLCSNTKDGDFSHTKARLSKEGEEKNSKNINKVISRKLIQSVSTASPYIATLQRKLITQAKPHPNASP
jgi:hypothetical protein